MPGHRRLFRRGAVYYHRAAVPIDIKNSYPKSEETFSLKTRDYSVALQRIRLAAVKVDQKFEAHRAGQPVSFEIEELSQDAINRLAELHFQQTIVEHDKDRLKTVQEVAAVADILVQNENMPSDAPEEPVQTGDYAKDHGNKLAYQQAVLGHEEAERQRNYAYRREIVENWKASIETTLQQAQDAYSLLDYQLYEPNVDALLKQENISLSKRAESYQSLVVAALASEIRAIEACIRKHKGTDDIEIRDRSDIKNDIKTAIGANDGPLLSEESDKWASDNLSGGIWKQKTKNTVLAAIERFIEFSGDRGIGTYTKADAREFREVLLKLPPNARQGRFKGLTAFASVALHLSGDGRAINANLAGDLCATNPGL